MADEAQTDPVFFDTLFHRKRKHGKWDVVDAPELEAPIADTHTHLQLLGDVPLALARCAKHKVDFLCTIVDVFEDGTTTFDQLSGWRHLAAVNVHRLVPRC